MNEANLECSGSLGYWITWLPVASSRESTQEQQETRPVTGLVTKPQYIQVEGLSRDRATRST